MKKPCGCEEGGPEIAASVRNAAALFASAGKVAGFVEGARWACDAFERVVLEVEPDLQKLELPTEKRKRIGGVLRQFCHDLRRQIEVRAPEQERMGKAAAAMVQQLERRRRPGILTRVKAAARALVL
jgi:hypothetical protein